jgi:DNA-binding NtrC family response regulator
LSKNNLFVDHEASVLQSYERMLHGEFEVDTALSGKAALASIQEKGPYAVVVSDIRMPGMDGVQLLARLRQVAPNTVRMVLTGQADLGAAMAAVNEGHIFHFLSKPCEKSVLTHSIKEAIAHYRGRREKRVEAELPVLLYRSTSGREREPVPHSGYL